MMDDDGETILEWLGFDTGLTVMVIALSLAPWVIFVVVIFLFS